MTTLIVALCAAGSFFFSGLETGLLSADQLGLYLKKERGVGYARAADFLLLRPERLLGTTLIGTNACVVTAAILVASSLREAGLGASSWLGSLALSFGLLIFTEVIPKSFFRRHADTVAVRLAPALLVFHFLLLPVSVVLNAVVRVLLVFGPQRRQRSKLPQSRDDLRLLVRLGSRVSGLDREEHRVFEEIFDFRGTLAREVMIQIHEYPVCPITASVRDAVRMGEEGRVRFLPVFQGRADNIVGYLDVLRLLYLPDSGERSRKVKPLLQPAVFYPDVKRLPDLLQEMNRRKLDLVFLSDEYGAVSGFITPNEIAAEIVGFVPGGPPGEEREIQVLESGHYLVAGATDIEDLYHETGINLRKRNYDTVGGYLSEQLGRIPQIGTSYEQGGFVYTVVDRDDRHIKRIEIRKVGSNAIGKKAE